MKPHPALSLRRTRDKLAWVVRQAQAYGRCFVITRDGEPAAAVVPVAVLTALDASDVRRARVLAVAVRRLLRLLPSQARAARAK